MHGLIGQTFGLGHWPLAWAYRKITLSKNLLLLTPEFFCTVHLSSRSLGVSGHILAACRHEASSGK